jgi:hypothetical protein
MANIVTLIDAQNDIDIAKWAQTYCTSFTGWLVVDMTPSTFNVDYRFYFDDERDALNFIMRWQGQYE